jgi:hypothetical protein
MSTAQVTEQYRDELELFREHTWRLVDSIGVRNEVGYSIALLGRALDATLGQDDER